MHSRSRPLLYAKNEAEAKRRRENSERDACYVELDHVARKLRKTESALAESKRVRRAHGVRSSLKPSMQSASKHEAAAALAEERLAEVTLLSWCSPFG